VEAIRALLVAKRSARAVRIKTVNQIRQLSFTAPEELRERMRGLGTVALMAEAASLRPRPGGGTVTYATKVALQTLGRRAVSVNAEAARIDELLGELISDTAPSLLDVFGVGVDTAATLLVAAGDNPERLRSEAARAHLCGVAPIPGFVGEGPAASP